MLPVNDTTLFSDAFSQTDQALLTVSSFVEHPVREIIVMAAINIMIPTTIKIKIDFLFKILIFFLLSSYKPIYPFDYSISS